LAHWIAERVGTKGAVASIDPLEQRIHIARSRGGALRFEVGQAEDLRAFEDEITRARRRRCTKTSILEP
jgi:ubiquinone/menaquinone biosynthesis C-methylase UbiE